MKHPMIRFKKITEENFAAVMQMKRPEGEGYVASNAYSLAQAWLYRDAGDVYPFAVYQGETPVGFMMLDEDAEGRCLVLWRIMFPPEHQNKGYGRKAIQLLIQLAKGCGKYDFIVLSCRPDNTIAVHLYESFGFRPTGEAENGEITLRLDL